MELVLKLKEKWNGEWKKFFLLLFAFLVFYYMPVDMSKVAEALVAGLTLLQDYAQKHVLTCLVPAFFIAGAIAVFVKKDSILQLLGPTAKKYIAYPIASVSGGILAVCSCTILPLFAGIYKRGAGIGPAVAFLFTGPAINVTAIFLTGNAVGWDFAFGRLIASIIIAITVGLLMGVIFREHDRRNGDNFVLGMEEEKPYSNWTIFFFMILQLGILVVLGLKINPMLKWGLAGFFFLSLMYIVFFKYRKEDNQEWVAETWDLTKKILPYLFVGIFAAGIIDVVVPDSWIQAAVGKNNLLGNAVASISGALMYFATLTEVPIIETLMKMGMARGPALTLFLTGNSLSIPSMIVIFQLMGRKKGLTYIGLICLFSVFAGMVFGSL
ncbi:MAG: permease [Calditrichia bacterium]